MSEEGGRPRFTTEERILIHLIPYAKLKDEMEVPLQTTQQGIAHGVGLGRKHTPRAVKAMIEKGLMIEQKAHVTDRPQRMKVYFLTDIGLKQGKDLREAASNIKVRLLDHGNEEPTTYHDLEVRLKDEFGLARIIDGSIESGIFDVAKVREEINSAQKKAHLDNTTIYMNALSQAWNDGQLSSDERDILVRLRSVLGISDEEHVKLESTLVGKQGPVVVENKVARNVYEVALEAALEDGIITEDEASILERIKDRFGLE